MMINTVFKQNISSKIFWLNIYFSTFCIIACPDQMNPLFSQTFNNSVKIDTEYIYLVILYITLLRIAYKNLFICHKLISYIQMNTDNKCHCFHHFIVYILLMIHLIYYIKLKRDNVLHLTLTLTYIIVYLNKL